MARISNQEWLNSNSNRVYPFREGASLSNGTDSIPKDFILDMILSGTNEQLIYRINYIEILSGAIQIGLSDSSGSFLGFVNIVTPVTSKYLVQFFQPIAGVSVRGKVTFGPGISEVSSWSEGRHLFGFSSSTLEDSILVPTPALPNVVTSLAKFGDTERLFTGDVKLIEGSGISIQPVAPMNGFIFSAAKVFKADCPEDLAKLDRCQRCIKTINGILPREDGNIDIVGTEHISVTNDSANHQIFISFNGDVNCCCIACDELDTLQQQVTQLQNGVNTMSAIVNQIP